MHKTSNKFNSNKKLGIDSQPSRSPTNMRYSKIVENYSLQMHKSNCSKTKNNSQTPTFQFKTIKRYLSQKNLVRNVRDFDSPVEYSLQKPEFKQLSEEDRRITMPILNIIQTKQPIEKPLSKHFLKKKSDTQINAGGCKQYEYILKQEELIYKPLQLKDTTSTSSADFTSKSQVFIPSFLRLKKNQKKKSIQQKSNFQKIKQLGKGKFGQVFLVKDIRTNFVLAMKVFEKIKILKSNLLEQFIRELKIQTFLNHSSIIKMYGFWCDQKNFYVLLQLGCDGELYSILEKKNTLSQEATSYILCSLLQAVAYLHKNKIIHRDIKPQNIVLIHGFPKICDFGWAVRNSNAFRDTYCGTPLYFSPQLLSRNCYDNKIDIWAIGILAYELRLGTAPFGIQSQQDLHKIITDSVKFPFKGTSSKFREFILAILKKNPNERVSCQQLLKYQFITHYQGLQACQQLI